jgi:hydrogenase nickel incorporation protein HypA/HybF
MHELSLVEGILKAALEEARRGDRKQIKEIRATIRESGHPMEADSLQALLEMMAKGTIAEEAGIKIELVPPTLKCKECGLTFSAQGHALMCPHCQSGRLEELDAEKIDLECSFSG